MIKFCIRDSPSIRQLRKTCPKSSYLTLAYMRNFEYIMIKKNAYCQKLLAPVVRGSPLCVQKVFACADTITGV
jgi:hypothetical protein